MDLEGIIIHDRYKVLEKIGEGGMSTVWLGTCLKDNSKVAVKVLKKGVTSERIEDLIHFRNEANTISKLNTPGTVKIFEVGEMDGLQYIIMEHLEGKNLFNLLQDGKRFSLDRVLEIICKICEVLKSIHTAGVIFRDLKPGNIIITNEDSLDLKLIDFGLSQIREYDYRGTSLIAGTLCYMSPEQCGVLKRAVDERSDLYSLGVMFYQLLTMKLPFFGDNINSIIHQHAVKIPDSPKDYNPVIPYIVESIVLKLLEKEPEKRYQSADGLLKDLKKVQKGETDFILSSNEGLFRLNYRTGLVGRDDEYFTLTKMYEDASNGRGGICLISGEAGKGKTRLSEELKNFTLKSGGIFIDGKCFSGENKMPYGVFKDALNAYIKEYSKFDDDVKKNIACKVKEAVGELGRIIIKLNPITYEILGECPELVELEPESESNRFKMVASQFLYALGSLGRPLMILLDDLQWVEEGSIGILNEISYNISEHPVLIIGTYRNNEVEDGHILSQYLRDGKERGYPIEVISLAPFDIGRMFIFISNLLYEKGKYIWKISEFIHKKSGGNPFFAIEILKQMITEKAIQRKDDKWVIANNILDNIQISSSIVEILLKRISTLSNTEKHVISQASVIGKKFDISFLFQLIELDHEELLKIIDKMVIMQFLEQSSNEKGELYFAHDRIMEVFYHSMETDERRMAHLKVANYLEAFNRNDTDKVVFELAHHYFEGREMPKAFEYAYLSGLKAKNSCAYETAYKYFMLAKNIMDGNADKEKHQIDYKIKLAEVATYISRNNEAIELLNSMLTSNISNMDKAEVYRLISLAYYNMGEFALSYNYGSKGLRLLGEKLPEGNIIEILSIIRELFVRQLYNHTKKSVYTRKIKHVGAENYIKIHSFYQTLNNMAAYYNIKKFIYGIIRGVNLVERKIGWSTDLGYGIGGYGGFNAATDKFSDAIKYFEIAVAIFTEMNNPLGLAHEYQFMGITYEFRGEFTKSIELLQKSMTILKSLGEIKGSNFSLNALIRQYYYLGDYETMNSYLDQYMGFYNKTKDTYIKNSASVYKAQYFRERGELEKSLECGNYMMDPAFEVKDWYNYCALCLSFGTTYLEMGDSTKALFYLEKSREINEKNSFFKQYVAPIYTGLAEAHIMKYNDMKGTVSLMEEKKLIKKIKTACDLALKKTSKFPTHHGVSLRVQAQYQLLFGNKSKAEVLFKKSIEHCRAYNRKYELGKSIYSYGMFLYSVWRHKESTECIKEAYEIFRQLDSKLYLSYCEKLLGINSNANTSVHTDKVSESIRNSQRMSSITFLAQQISSIFNFELLLDNIMQSALEITGAQDGYLFLKEGRNGKLKQVLSKVSENIAPNSTSISESILNKVLESGKAVISTNAMEDEAYSRYDSVLMNNIKSVLCFPIKYNEEIKGICYLDNKITSSVFTEDDINILSIFMTQAAISIENAELYKMAITDGLTGLINQKHFKTLLDIEIERSRRYKRQFSLILLDIDYFKKVNDEYGHQAGDEVLFSLGEALTKVSRKSDVLARYGGEEFAIILPEINKENALLYAEKLRKSIESMVVRYRDNFIKISISLGLAEYPGHSVDGNGLINAADTALYISKQNGRNRTTIYADSPESKTIYASI